jgi:hypothetical protein
MPKQLRAPPISPVKCHQGKPHDAAATISVDGFLWRKGAYWRAMESTTYAQDPPRAPASRPLEARFHRAPQILLALGCWAAAAAIIFAWIEALDTSGLQPVLARAAVSGLAAGSALFFVLGVVFLRAALLVRPLALAIDDRGIWFGQPDIALIPWSRVLRTEFFDAAGRRRFGVVTMGPAPRMAARTLTATFAWEPVDDGVRVSLLIDRLDINESHIARTVRWFAPPVMRVTSRGVAP